MTKRVRIALGSLAVALVLSLFAPLAMRTESASASSAVPTTNSPTVNADGVAGMVWQGYLFWGWGYFSVTNSHWGQTYQNPTIDGWHETAVFKAFSNTNDRDAYFRVHISKPNQNSTGCLLVQDAIHTWIHGMWCGPDKWNIQGAVYAVIAAGAGFLGWIIGDIVNEFAWAF